MAAREPSADSTNHFVALHRFDAVDQIRRVEGDDQIFAGEVAVDRFGGVTHFLADHRQVDPALAHGQAHRGGVVPHQQLHPPQSGQERFLPQVEPVGVVVRDELVVVRVAALQQPGADLDVSLPKRDFVAAGRHADVAAVTLVTRRGARAGVVVRPAPGPAPGGPPPPAAR